VTELMIIADDFTGALDAGVHFAERGIGTRVIVSLDHDRRDQVRGDHGAGH
jgi:uncharacterized protein YgbK (DUF1537 family)